MDEALGSPDALEETIRGIEGVQSVEVTDVRRAIG
jgi:translation elongation factor EF-1beta